MFKVIKKQGKARRGVFTCAHGGEVQTPVFMNVGTQAAIKGGVSALDLKEQLGTQIELSNTYHLQSLFKCPMLEPNRKELSSTMPALRNIVRLPIISMAKIRRSRR